MTPSREDSAARATAKPWLSIVGIGEDSPAGLGEAARTAIAEAAFVFGGARHIELAAPLIAGEKRQWPSPFDVTAVLDLVGQKVCVLASGDPFRHGVGATLARELHPSEYTVFPAPSAFSLAAARLGWPLQDVATISLHGRLIEHLRPLLHPATRILALTSDGAAPAAIARMITELGFGASSVCVLEAMGGPSEQRTDMKASETGDRQFGPLNVLGIEVVADDGASVLPLAGIGDELFEHDGQITKREIRALTLSALAPRRGELLWDVGAGSGSIAITWMLKHPSMRAVAIEQHADRAQRIRLNADTLGVPELSVIEGSAPAALADLTVPDAIFIGGGGADGGMAEAAIEALKPGGRLVANAVTVETETLLADLHARLGGDLIRIALSRAAPVGTMTGWRPAMPVTQWIWTKP